MRWNAEVASLAWPQSVAVSWELSWPPAWDVAPGALASPRGRLGLPRSTAARVQQEQGPGCKSCPNVNCRQLHLLIFC